MKNKLTVEQSVLAIFILCSRVTEQHSGTRFYLKPQNRSYTKVVKYILKLNGIKSGYHLTKCYDYFKPKHLVIRVNSCDLLDNQEFQQKFTEKYYAETGKLGFRIQCKTGVPVMFRFLSGAKKQNFITKLIVERDMQK